MLSLHWRMRSIAVQMLASIMGHWICGRFKIWTLNNNFSSTCIDNTWKRIWKYFWTTVFCFCWSISFINKDQFCYEWKIDAWLIEKYENSLSVRVQLWWYEIMQPSTFPVRNDHWFSYLFINFYSSIIWKLIFNDNFWLKIY